MFSIQRRNAHIFHNCSVKLEDWKGTIPICDSGVARAEVESCAYAIRANSRLELIFIVVLGSQGKPFCPAA